MGTNPEIGEIYVTWKTFYSLTGFLARRLTQIASKWYVSPPCFRSNNAWTRKNNSCPIFSLTWLNPIAFETTIGFYYIYTLNNNIYCIMYVIHYIYILNTPFEMYCKKMYFILYILITVYHSFLKIFIVSNLFYFW